MKVAVDTARLALRRSIELRKSSGVPMDHACSVVDLTEHPDLGVEVWYAPLPSLAGIYSKHPEAKIVLGSDRPTGFQALTCAHELGHHVFGHGDRIDEYKGDGQRGSEDDPDEQIATLFGIHLTMPRAAVLRGLSLRHLRPSELQPADVFKVAGWLGVGYSALVHHLLWTLQLINHELFEALVRVRPGDLRRELVGDDVPHDLVVVDHAWVDRAVDLVDGDLALLPPGCLIEGRAVEIVRRQKSGVLVRARRRGLARADQLAEDWSAFLRVMPRRYSGAACYRHLEDPDE